MSRDDSSETGLPRNGWRETIGVPLLLLVGAACSLLIDVPVSRYFKYEYCPKFFVELLQNCEPFGQFYGASAVMIAIVLLDPARRGRIGWIVGATFGAGTLASASKLFIRRTRPRVSDLLDGTVWDTFGGWLQFDRDSRLQSFPSGHTATAVGFAMFLSAWYPKGRWLFLTLAMLVGMQRIQIKAHFPSDVLAGAAVGWFIASCCVRGDRRWSQHRIETQSDSGCTYAQASNSPSAVTT